MFRQFKRMVSGVRRCHARRFFVACAALAAVGLSGRAYAQQFTRVSVATDDTQGNGAGSSHAVLSGNGRFVAFISFSSNLVASDTQNDEDVFVRDLVSNTTTRVSVASDGTERFADAFSSLFPMAHIIGPGISLSADGAIVVFASRASLVAEDTNRCPVPSRFGNSTLNCADIYVHDRTTGQASRVSVASDGTQANAESGDPQISADGRFVVFTSNATNLVPGDQNGTQDVFLHDRLSHTTTRVSVSSSGNDLNAPSYGGAVSGDGRFVAFISESAAVTTVPDPIACENTGGGSPTACARAFVLDRNTGTVTRMELPVSAAPDGATVLGLAMTPDGRFIAVNAQRIGPGGSTPEAYTIIAVYDRQTGRVDVDYNSISSRPGAITINDSGRFVSVARGSSGLHSFPRPAVTFDRQTNSIVSPPDVPFPSFTIDEPIRFTADGLRVLFSDSAPHVADDTNTVADVYLQTRDADNDGMPDTWETQFGLNPNDPADAALDSDGDGVTNLQEYLAGTHPKGTFKRYFAEGAANSFFSTEFAVFNPGDQPTTAVLEFLGSNSQLRSTTVSLPAHGWSAVQFNDTTSPQPDNDFSTIIEADHPVVVDRTMTWDKTSYGSHAETAIEAPATTWYLAEGSTGGTFDLFYLLQNPGDAAATVAVNYLLPAPAAPVVKTYIVAPKSRRTIYVDQEGANLAATDLSAKITSDQPILVERAMYFSTPSQPFAAGHEGAAVTAPATSWFLAEGATGSFFDLFVLIANAEATDAQVKVTYLLESGAPIVKNYTIPAHSRVTINVDGEDPRLLDSPVSTIVESTNTVPVIVERAMWWPSPNWYEAHLSAGATTTGTKWALAEGLVTNAPAGSETETYILIANTTATAGAADVTLFFADGTSLTTNVPLPANSRVSVPVSVAFPTAIGKGGYGTIIQSNGPQIVVERAMYTNANGVTWAAGTDALATRLQ